jgi:hypothetical protein
MRVSIQVSVPVQINQVDQVAPWVPIIVRICLAILIPAPVRICLVDQVATQVPIQFRIRLVIQVPTYLVSQATTQAPIPVRISPTIQVSTQSIREYKQDFQSHATPIKIQSIGETQQKPGWPSPIHPLIPLMP